MDDYVIKASVRDIIEFVLRSGDLTSGFTGISRATEAIKAHQLVQKAYVEGSQAEIPVSYMLSMDGIDLEIGGRIDGLIKENDEFIIDEIKTTTLPLELLDEDFNMLHWAQAEFYGYIYTEQNSIDEMDIQLTYYNLDSKTTKIFRKSFTHEWLENFFMDVTKRYIEWAKIIKSWYDTRNESIINLGFPFSEYRKGQRNLAVSVYKSIKDGKKLFARAPTGIGKTMAVLFPSVKAMGEGLTSKIFYLTAKTVGASVAENACEMMKASGLKLKTITLTAKDKICFMPEATCNPEECPYAKGHFDRINTALEDIFHEDSYTRERIEEYAKKHTVCPFEFSLDLSLWSDCIICDYNYVFDPRAYLKRFFAEGGQGDYILLIDEAHNLVDRAREMFSADINKKSILSLKKTMKDISKPIYKSLSNINNYFIQLRKNCEANGNSLYTDKEKPKEIYSLLYKFTELTEEYLIKNKSAAGNDELMEAYFNALAFLKTADNYNEKYITYIEKIDDDIKLKLFCLDPSELIAEALKRGKSAVFFSATLNPMDYFYDILGGDETSLKISLTSPFPGRNLEVMINNRICTKYKIRENTYNDVAHSIHTFINGKKGNYLVYFPSYKYLNEVCEIFRNLDDEADIICQTSNMKEEDKEEFLSRFNEENTSTLVGFAVMGGVFGEGIDLTGDRLTGAVIVGVGLPQICFERDIIKDYFNEKNGAGFEYAYLYPGMNKVMQAAGRVIRTETDRGVVLLIDERFTGYAYKRLFPPEWRNMHIVRNTDGINHILSDFWAAK